VSVLALCVSVGNNSWQKSGKSGVLSGARGQRPWRRAAQDSRAG
jgi:hypothetical protein